MKNFKKVTAAIAATLMAAAMSAPMAMNFYASAAETASYTLAAPTLPANATISNVKAIKIFSGEITDGQFSVSDWGADVSADAKTDLIAAAGLSGEKTASDVAQALAAESDNSAIAKAFAEAAVTNLGSAKGISGDYDNGTVTFESVLETGYYVVMCEARVGETGNWFAKSLGMLTLTGGDSATIGIGKAKVGLPEVQKKVEENQEANLTGVGAARFESENSKYNDVADYNIGDPVPFKLYGTLPDDYDEYDTYLYRFNDTLATQFNAPASVTVNVGTASYTFNRNPGDGVYACINEGGTGNATIEVNYSEGNLTVQIADLKKCIAKKADAGTGTGAAVTVSYSAVLNDNANIGQDGQENKVTLTYSNNPNQSGEGKTETGDTPEDKVIVFTYDMKFEKKFWNGTSDLTQEEIANKTYEGLEFVLADSTGEAVLVKECSDSEYDYVVCDASDNDKVSSMKLTVIGESGNQKLVIRIKGLDEGKYTIQESGKAGDYTNDKTQTGTITADTKNTQNDYDKTDDNKKPIGTIEHNYGSNKTGDDNSDGYGDVDNTKGIQLPSTGGVGTTLFYLGGGAMVAAAGVFLITKKRMKKEEV